MSSNELYFLNQAVPQGSAFYYSVSHLCGEQRTSVIAIQAFYQQLIDIVYQSNDANVAQIKFQWWRNEISGEPSHPLSKLLKSIPPQFKIQSTELVALIDGVEEKIHIQPFMNFEELTIHIMRTTGLKEKIIAQIISPELNVELIYQLAMVEELISLIQFLRRDCQKGIIFFPVDELDKFQVTVTMLEHFKTTPQIKSFLEYEAQRIFNLYEDAQNKLSANDKKSLRSLLVRDKIAITTLNEIKKENYKVLEHFTKLTPIRMWWLSFTY